MVCPFWNASLVFSDVQGRSYIDAKKKLLVIRFWYCFNIQYTCIDHVLTEHHREFLKCTGVYFIMQGRGGGILSGRFRMLKVRYFRGHSDCSILIMYKFSILMILKSVLLLWHLLHSCIIYLLLSMLCGLEFIYWNRRVYKWGHIKRPMDIFRCFWTIFRLLQHPRGNVNDSLFSLISNVA